MEMMQKIAPKYGLVCLLHEKPFEGVNGSGKHNNWSISAGHENLLDPGDTPMENLQFLVFLAAVIKAVDEYADLLRTSVATPGNDHRLGANEAPPAIISIFVGEELEAVIDAIASDSPYAGPVKMKMDLGVDVLPKFSKDTTDRNRTSPFAFTGNKFEFRMPGSHENLSDANTILNTAVAKELKGYADELEASEDFPNSVIALVKRTIRDHRRISRVGDRGRAPRPAQQEVHPRGPARPHRAQEHPADGGVRRHDPHRDVQPVRGGDGALRQDHQHRGPDHAGDGPQAAAARRQPLHGRPGPHHHRQARRQREPVHPRRDRHPGKAVPRRRQDGRGHRAPGRRRAPRPWAT